MRMAKKYENLLDYKTKSDDRKSKDHSAWNVPQPVDM